MYDLLGDDHRGQQSGLESPAPDGRHPAGNQNQTDNMIIDRRGELQQAREEEITIWSVAYVEMKREVRGEE